MKRGVLCNNSATMRRLLARSDEPVSVTSTMASASRGGLTSVAPQLNSTWALTPCSASQRRVKLTTSVAMRLPCKSFTSWIGEIVAAALEGDLVTGLAEQFRGGFLQAAGWEAEAEDLSVHFL